MSQVKTLSLRVPITLWVALNESAQGTRRSLNSEIVVRLEESLNGEPARELASERFEELP